ncbi:DUF4254 domain-containing protein [Terriglobus albidus]|uniref:DUF4254 domain-containing protein n=1 Tax=Terriglobus albidus TaxID=1592106 RepID=A0A5B9EFN2_9BACT|nr:DUF4254 domain-containing protein [Terriglobus albidus]QEE29925.1 DUF4254 domain-containing protein [Terriglobus albidus]
MSVPLLDAFAITAVQDLQTKNWHLPEPPRTTPADPFERLLSQLHRANFDLWHEEDRARDPNASSDQIAITKRAIDILNQRRNDVVEQLDRALLDALTPLSLPNADAALHSETPGLILDRLSILALKIFHTQEQIDRTDITEEHRSRNQARLAMLTEQRNDLAGCLDALWSDVTGGRRRFKLYRQLKMYNDPTLNPVLYARRNI